MPDRENVIKGLECCIIYVNCGANGGCPYKTGVDEKCLETVMKDALALLKAQEPKEPRVMTVDEVGTWISVPRIDREPIWVETENSVNAWIVSDEYWDIPIDVNLSSDLYDKTWRCWTSRPTDEQRRAVKWE